MSMSRRVERMNSQLRRDLSELVQTEVKDPRIAGFVSITRVDTSVDFEHARVYVSVYGTLREKEKTIAALTSAAGFIRSHLRRRLETRQVPYLRFMIDETLDQGNEMLDLLDSLADQMGPPEEEPEESTTAQ